MIRFPLSAYIPPQGAGLRSLQLTVGPHEVPSCKRSRAPGEQADRCDQWAVDPRVCCSSDSVTEPSKLAASRVLTEGHACVMCLST